MVSARLFPAGRLPTQIHNDQDFFLRVTDDRTAFPLTDWINQGDWGGDDHCALQGTFGVTGGDRHVGRPSG